MADEVLGIQITADAAGAVRGIQQATGAINKLPVAANKATAAIAKMPAATNQANFALTNLSRVAQDAPYGFIGIQNNLNPLLESFQRLRQETGSNAGALKQLGKSLIGAGGVGLAIGVVSSLWLVFGKNLTKGSAATKKAAEAAKEAAENLKEMIKPMADIRDQAASMGGEISKVQALSAAILDQTKSYKERNNALDQLKKINKNYFGDLTLEKESLEKLTGVVAEYTKALIAAAVVKEFSSEIGKLAVELSKQDRLLSKSGAELQKYSKAAKSAGKTATQAFGGQPGLSGSIVQADKDLQKATGSFKKQAVVVVQLKNQMAALQQAMQDAVNESLKFKPLEADKDTLKTAKDPMENLLKNRLKLFDEYRAKFKAIGEFTNFTFLPIIDFSKLPKDFGNATSAIREQLSDMFKSMETAFILNGKKAGVLYGKELADAIAEEIESKKNPFANALEKIGLAKGLVIPIEIKPIPPRQSSFTDILEGLQTAKTDTFGNRITEGITDQAIIAAETINGVLTPAFDNMFEAIKNGEQPLQAFFDGILESIGEVIKALIKAAIQAAILSVISAATGGGLSFGQAFGKLTGMGGVARPQSIMGGSRAALSVTVNGSVSGNSYMRLNSRTSRLNGLFG